MSWKAFQGKILKRCDICKRFHASFKAAEEDGGGLYCARCWKARFGETAEKKVDPPQEPKKAL